MARFITGTRPKIEIKTLEQSISEEVLAAFWGHTDDIVADVKRRNNIPKEALLGTRKDKDLGLIIYTWTWYEIEV